MTWSYSGDPATNDKDAVRWLVDDIDSTNQLVQNEEINWALSQFGGPIQTAAVVCEQIAGQLAKGAIMKKVGSLTISRGEAAKQYQERCKTLRKLIGTKMSDLFVGGLSISEKEQMAQENDAVQPFANRGQDDFPGTRDNARIDRPDRWGW